jgi:hypothetical protein
MTGAVLSSASEQAIWHIAIGKIALPDLPLRLSNVLARRFVSLLVKLGKSRGVRVVSHVFQ